MQELNKIKELFDDFIKDGKDATFSEDFKHCDFYRDNELTKL